MAAGTASGESAVPDARLAVRDMLNGFSRWFQEDRELVVGRLPGPPDYSWPPPRAGPQARTRRAASASPVRTPRDSTAASA